jgi:hypothetical protein
MGKDVVVIASGETERQSLPHLVAHLEAEGITLLEVRIPRGGKALNVELAEKLVKASWFERIAAPPDKFVVLARFNHGLHTDRRAETSPLCLEQSHVPRLVPRRRREPFAIAPQLDAGTAWPSTTAPRLGYSRNCRAAEATRRPRPG